MRIGIVGCGKIAQVRHIPEYAANPDATLTAFFDIDTKRAREIASGHSAKAYDSASALFASGEVDAVSICAANYAHAQLTIEALQAGLDVLCEKPMAVTLEECEDMIAAKEKSGRRLLIGQNQRFAMAHDEARKLIEAGEIGKVISFRTIFGHAGPETWSVDPGKDTWFFDKKRAAMGAMADLGIHKTDALRYMLGADVVRTTARLVTLDKRGADGNLIGVDDNAICIYEMSNGAIGTMSASWTYYGAEDNSTIIYGTEGIMRIYEDPAHSIVLIKKDGSRKNIDVDRIQTNDNQTASGVIDEFVEAVKTGRESILDVEKVIGSMKAVFASIRSAEEGKTIDV